MFARKASFLGRKVILTTVAALALSAAAPSASFAGGHRWHGGGGGFAAGAAIAGIVGTGLAIAATQNRDAYAYDSYGGGPVYYGGPAYYGSGPYYGPGPNYQYQRYGGDSPAAACGQGYMAHCY